MSNTIALIADDASKEDLINFVLAHAPTLARYQLIATATIGERIQLVTNLPIQQKLADSLGGIVQIAAEITTGNVIAVICLVDPSINQGRSGLDALLQICQIHNVAIAINLATAEAIVNRLAKTQVAHLIFNPVAGQRDAKQDLAIIRQLLNPYFSLKIHQTTPEIDADELVKTAVSANADLVIAAGGDGTVSAVAGGLIGKGIPLGIIPRGTANAFAVTLGIPRLQPIRHACQVILAGHSQAIDAAYCNGFPMILLAGIGYEASMVELADRDLKNRWGSLAYLMSGWKTIDEQQPFEIELKSSGKLYQFSAGAITVANAAPSTSVLAQGAGQVLWNDGLLDVTIVTAEDKLEAVTTLLKLFGAGITKTELAEKNVVHGRTQKLKIATNPPQKVVVDGEIIGTTPVEIECIPNGLTVLVSEATVLFTR